MAADIGRAVWPSLDGVEGDLRCLSDNGDNSHEGSGPSGSSYDGRLGMRGNTGVTAS
jgi:hypothetical protein